MHNTTVLEVSPEEVKNYKILAIRLGPVQLYVFKKQGGQSDPCSGEEG
jgi:hypothetical protein